MSGDDGEDIRKLLAEQNALLGDIKKAIEVGADLLGKQNRKLEQIRYSVATDMQEVYYSKVLSHQLSFIDTLREVATRRMSMARFGDGELGLAADATRSIAFQRGSFELAEQLRNLLSEPRDGLLVCLPGVTVDVFWMTWIARYWGILNSVIPESRLWGMTNVSRSDAFKADGKGVVDAWRACWAGRKVTVVTGSGSRFSAVPELFSSAQSIDYVYGPAKDAFNDLAVLKREVLAKRADLVLIALGPAGTVLAADLHESGLQALDIGHLSNSYDEHFNGGVRPEQLPIDQTQTVR